MKTGSSSRIQVRSKEIYLLWHSICVSDWLFASFLSYKEMLEKSFMNSELLLGLYSPYKNFHLRNSSYCVNYYPMIWYIHTNVHVCAYICTHISWIKISCIFLNLLWYLESKDDMRGVTIYFILSECLIYILIHRYWKRRKGSGLFLTYIKSQMVFLIRDPPPQWWFRNLDSFHCVALLSLAC